MLGLLALSVVPAGAASFPCNIPFLKPAELAICQDTQLSRLDDDTARKARSLQSRLSYGQYLGLRYWQSRNAEAREQCGSDRQCLLAAVSRRQPLPGSPAAMPGRRHATAHVLAHHAQRQRGSPR